jgi:hypothetical protein
MSIEATRWALKVRGLSLAEKAILFVLADAHNGKTGKCFPSLSALSDAADCTVRIARKHLAGIEAKGLFTRTVTSFGKGLTTFYELHLDMTEANDTRGATGQAQTNEHSEGQLAKCPSEGQLVPADQMTLLEGPNDTRGVITIEEPEYITGIPSSEANASSEGRTSDLFEASPSSPPAISKREMATDIVFRIGKPLLSRDGLSPKEAGAFLGKLIKNSNLEIVARVVSQAALAPPVDARQWLTAAANAEARKAGLTRTVRKSGPTEWPKVLNTWFDSGTWPRHVGPDPTDTACLAPTHELEAVLAKFETGHPTARSIRRVIDARKPRTTATTAGANHA